MNQMLDKSIADLRISYSKSTLLENEVSKNPFDFFKKWFDEAITAEVYETNAMALSTVDKYGMPHSRIVLLKSVEENGFVFFTNYNSHKGKNIEENSNVALLFFWKELERQVRIEGSVAKISSTDSENYFYSRPIESQLGAIASHQSEKIESREKLEAQYNLAQENYTKSNKISMPNHWGGYIVEPVSIEFWQGRESRLHDRILYAKNENNGWEICRLQP